jgi:hypothetical protein
MIRGVTQVDDPLAEHDTAGQGAPRRQHSHGAINASPVSQ